MALVVLPDSRPVVSPLVRLLESRALVATGLASYSLFLWHEPLIRWLAAQDWTLPGRPGFVVNLAVVGALAGALTALTYRLVERPALSRRSGSADAPSAPGPPALGGAVDG